MDGGDLTSVWLPMEDTSFNFQISTPPRDAALWILYSSLRLFLRLEVSYLFNVLRYRIRVEDIGTGSASH